MNIQDFISRYEKIRSLTESLCEPLLIEDYVIQSIEDVSPPKWHLAHTTWFFETFILQKKCKYYRVFNPLFQYLFNSYYQGINVPYPRPRRGILARPTVQSVYQYRHYVNEHLINYIQELSDETFQLLSPLIEIGLQHEQQHQELLLMDIKHNFSMDAHKPVYYSCKKNSSSIFPMEWITFQGSETFIGHIGNGFCFDNELSRHATIVPSYQLASRLVTNGEYLEFILSDGYQKPIWWLSDGWDCIQKNQWQAPLYWEKLDNKWHIFTLNGLQELNVNEPVTHVSYYEADAYSRWYGARLPSEIEWEHAAFLKAHHAGNFLESHFFHPMPPKSHEDHQFLGDGWEWTASAYMPYPGFKPLNGLLAEYNGKFMSNQMVLRGGSCVTPQSHIRLSYRNFFQPDKRWVFSGIRLAKNLEEKTHG